MRIAAAILGLVFAGAAQSAGPESSPVERGKYLARAADCFACHTSDDGAAYAGGRPLVTPFGTIYSTNITPDDDTGIGGWTKDEFHQALHDGELPDGTQLYPAMPYTSYHLLTREDTDAIYAYIMSVEPVTLDEPENELGFPYNQRWGLNLWNLLYKGDRAFQPDPERSESYNRGAYLASALGHCAECHTPRNRFGAMNEVRHFAGSELGHIWPPDITPEALAQRGWSKGELRAYLRNGLSRLGAANGEMFPAVVHSTHYLTDTDLDAMVNYLAGGESFQWPQQPRTVEQVDPTANDGEGRRIYLNVCAGCHAADGEGIPNTAVPLAGNATVRLADPHNLIAVILDGLPLQDFPGFARMQPMPGFADELSDQQLAALASYVRATWGGRSSAIESPAVAEVRDGGHQ